MGRFYNYYPVMRSLFRHFQAEKMFKFPDGIYANGFAFFRTDEHFVDRKSTRLNSSHGYISYAVFCLKKKTYNAFSLAGETALVTGLTKDLGRRIELAIPPAGADVSGPARHFHQVVHVHTLQTTLERK